MKKPQKNEKFPLKCLYSEELKTIISTNLVQVTKNLKLL